MAKQLRLAAAGAVLFFVGAATAQQFPILNEVAGRVIQKYESATCEQLWESKGKPKSEQEQRVIGLLQSDPQMRQAFLDQVAAPIANKLFQCGLIP
jgi:hypothetical protein